MKLQIINPITYPNWDDLLLNHEDYSFFHSSSWASVLSESYHYKPLYFTSVNNGKLETLVPIMEVNSPLTGKRGVSLPFTDYCQPIASNENAFREVNQEIIKYGEQAKWRYIEWRDVESYFKNKTPSVSFYTHDLNLDKDEYSVLYGFRDSTRRNIQKAQKLKVQVGLHHSLESIQNFFRLNCMTRKKHGLPPQPFIFFQKVYEHIISNKQGIIALATYNQKVIAGVVCFHYGRKAIFKFGASDTDYFHLRPNNLLMWEVLKWYLENGFNHFQFGITELRNEGLLQYKRGWRPAQKMIHYYKYDIINNKFVKDRFRGKTSYLLFRKMPSPLLKITGSLLYRHFA